MALLNTTLNGSIAYCSSCKVYHLEFGNLFFNFSENELTIFTEYINGIDGDYFNAVNHHTANRRKILLPTKLKGIHFALHAEELQEFKNLLNYKKTNNLYINVLSQIKCGFSAN